MCDKIQENQSKVDMQMLSFKELKKRIKNCDENTAGDPKIAILGDTATQLLHQAVKGYGISENINLNIYEAEYNQIYNEIMFKTSHLYSFNPQYLLLYLSTEKLYEHFCETDNKSNFANETIDTILTYWSAISESLSCKILQYTFPEYDDLIFGNYGCKTPESFIFQLRKMNLLIMEKAAANKAVYIIDICGLQNRLGKEFFFSEKFYYSAKLSISPEALPYVAKETIEVIKACTGKIKKCIILDLDNTLWGGVIGDDGMSHIQIGELGIGRAFTDFQRWLKELKKRGIILAVCSKNNEDTAKQPFIEHPEMILRLEDIAIFVANWNDKAQNIRYIQSVLNIGMDSLIFIDDNPFERELVKSMIPEIEVPDLPGDPALYRSYVSAKNYFETASVSAADAERTKQYRQEASRTILKAKFESFDDYLKDLDMLGTKKPFNEFNISRISQLTQRSNQFNLRTIRYTEDEISEISASDKHLTLYFNLKDKFGDHGLISVVILKKIDENTLFIDTWLMSCRVLKRTVEEFIINSIVDLAFENGCKLIIGEYIETGKNSMVKEIYSELGFEKESETKFIANIDNFSYNKTFIKNVGE